MDNRTITLQELLEYMSMLRDDMNALTVAFSYLASSLPKEQMIQILAFIHFESNNSRWSSEQQKSFKWLASLLEGCYTVHTNIFDIPSKNH
ncbi:hypothetical protein ACSFU9_005112 [Escherichia coli]|uniref:Ybl58 n=5 Tax=Escherichia coli TaxID=562 RepID=A0A0D8W7H7_ECOLX|nr:MULTISPECIES: hypothetical protein [Enterobacteriaceae]EFN8687642.1 hypothetical protein [Escherichia coli O119]OSL75970.1 hypothetical protein EAWG_02700 [Escherichia coli TA008]AWR82773.1 hypothetical protein B9T59_17870 [Escherichia coli]AYW30748.1 hypothetical protein CQP61_15370 [Escherichia coli]EAB9245261.1 hypothetical protein [Escherichia coli]